MNSINGASPARREEGQRRGLAGLCLGALGVVYGDIGTSPLYTLEICLDSVQAHRTVAPADVLGIVSLMFWSLMIVVTFKYVLLILRIDNKGEGGILALLALVLHEEPRRFRAMAAVLTVALLGTAFFFADAAITPAISVLSAVEGLEVLTPTLTPLVLPITVGILIGLFAIQRRGTAKVGALFGPVMLVWFAALAVTGFVSIVQTPEILAALDPRRALTFLFGHGLIGFLILGSVVLTVTGAEALFADMGHFGRAPIRLAWLFYVLPALAINYFGQAALVLRDPAAAENPFYLLASNLSPSLLGPMIVLATFATIIASQAVISGAYSMAQQAVQLGLLPRLQVLHTSETEHGQIYAPRINWLMLASVLLLVGIFHTSTNLAAAYGVAVTGTMLTTTLLGFVLHINRRARPPIHPIYIFAPLMVVDLAFFSTSFTKIGGGGIVPIAFGLVLFFCMSTWRNGRQEITRQNRASLVPLIDFIASMAKSSVVRVPGTAVFLSAEADLVPDALLHNLKHNKVLHERVVLLTIHTENEPHVRLKDRVTLEDLGHGFYRVQGHYGFMDQPDVMAILRQAEPLGLKTTPMDTSYFLGRETYVPASRSVFSRWREHLFIFLSRSAQSASDYFRLPSNRVVELGTQVEI